jgi:lipopolysaccharide/colanic/teichoic acid biosynthesis glycosyltransferase
VPDLAPGASRPSPRHSSPSRRVYLLKRPLDIVVATLLILLLGPVMLAVAIVVRCALGRPVLFRQDRPGRNARSFSILKFRTMRDAVDSSGTRLEDAERLTRIGRWLRSSSLDELPELFNVLRGDMSLVGPRPLLVEYLPLYSAEHASRHNVRPGLTGWAQINGRNALSWDERLSMDVWYVQHASLRLDLHILLGTVSAVLRREGIGHGEEATMTRFTGSGHG